MVATARMLVETSKECRNPTLCYISDNADYESDSSYPDPYAGGYKGPKNCGGFAPTAVISVSYSGAEGIFPATYMDRQCNE